jgi:Rrf2 family protein
MKLTSQEEYGLRCLLCIARAGRSLTIPEISTEEGISAFYAAKLVRILRRSGIVTSVRGQAGGYQLARPAGEIRVGEVLALLGGRLFEPAFCHDHAGVENVCANSLDCSIRSLWRAVQEVVDHVLNHTTLRELLAHEPDMEAWVKPLIQVAGPIPASLRPADPSSP